jgi:parallel beta-helix repeat protein
MAYAVDVSLVNNVVVGTGTDVVHAFGADTSPLSALLKHNTLVADSALYGVSAHNYSTVTMINNIVTGCSVTGIYVADATSSITADHTLFFGNVDDGEMGTNPLIGNPLFRNPAGFDYHLRPRSAAVDAGVDAGITIDLEAKRRPMGNGYDIGAYEFVSGFAPGVNLLLLAN